MDNNNNLSNKDVVSVLTLMKYENHAEQTEDHWHVQISMTRIYYFVKGYAERIQARTGVDLAHVFGQYGIATRSHVKSLAKRGYFGSLSRTIDLKTNLYPDKFYLLGVWYHVPSNNAVDFHRLTQKDIDNVADLLISSLAGDSDLSEVVYKRNANARETEDF